MLQFAKDGDEPECNEDDADELHIQSTSDITFKGPAAEQTRVDGEMAGENPLVRLVSKPCPPRLPRSLSRH